MSKDLLLEMQQRTNHKLHLPVFLVFSVHSQSMVSFAFAAFGLSSAIFVSALITGIIVLSIKGSQ